MSVQRRRSLMFALVGGVALLLYWPLLRGEVPAFRDTFHFYYPLQIWLDQQAGQGNYFPQFNPFDGTGVNLVGEATTALFYPGRCLFWLPWLSVAQRLGLYLLLHQIIAGAGAAYAARRMILNEHAQWLAGIAYALSCPVYFSCTNPVFLVGAAWLPWALAESGQLARQLDDAQLKTQPPMRWWLWIMATSFMLLGGDAQATVNTGLLTLLAWACFAIRSRDLSTSAKRLSQFVFGVACVTGITAVQWLPTWYWLKHVDRVPAEIAATWDEPAMQRDAVPELLRSALAAEQSKQEVHAASPRGSRYAFSLAPWHFVTLVWGQLSGNLLPENTRVFSALPAEGLMWVPSLSAGLLPFLLAVSALWNKPLRKRLGYWWLVLLLSAGAMLGNYAPMWLLRSLLLGLGYGSWAHQLPPDETLGLYWLLNQVVPMYEGFRFPTKWSIIFSLSFSLIAAQALHCLESIGTELCRWCVCVMWASVLGLAVGLVLYLSPGLWQLVQSRVDASPADPWLGELDLGATQFNVMFSLVMTGVISFAMWWSLRLSARGTVSIIVLLTLMELTYLGKHWIVTVPAPMPQSTLLASTAVDTSAIASPLVRLWAPPGQADLNRDRPDLPQRGPARVQALVDYQQTFQLGKLHLLSSAQLALPPTANLSALLTLPPQALTRVRRVIAANDHFREHAPDLEKTLAWLGVHQRLVRTAVNDPGELHWQAVENARPLIARASGPTNTLHVKYFFADRVEVSVATESPDEFIIGLYQDGGWRAAIVDASGHTTLQHPRSSHLGLFQRLAIPAGQWTITFQYTAPGLWAGLIISTVTILLTVARALLPVFFS